MALHTLVGINLTRLLPKNLFSPAIFKTRYSLAVFAFSTACETKRSTSPVYYLLAHKHRLSHAVASRVASVLDPFGCQKKYGSVLTFFVQMSFTKAQLEKILNVRPQILAADLKGTIKPKIEIFEDLGFSSEEITAIVSKQPLILHTSLYKRIIPALAWLKGMLGSNEKVARVLRDNGRLLTTDLEKHVLPNFRILMSHGMTEDEVARLIYVYPRVILCNRETLRRCLDTKDKMGISWSSKMSVYAVGVICSMPNGSWERKLLAFQEIFEFSNDEMIRILRQTPTIFRVSEDKMRKVKQIVLGTGKYDTSSIAAYPRALMCSIERRLKPRFEVLGKLESKGLIEEWLSLGYVCRLTDEKFCEVNGVDIFLRDVSLWGGEPKIVVLLIPLKNPLIFVDSCSFLELLGVVQLQAYDKDGRQKGLLKFSAKFELFAVSVMEDHKERNAPWLSVPQFGDWDQKGELPDYSMDFSKIREMRKQNKRDPSRASLGNEEELITSNTKSSSMVHNDLHVDHQNGEARHLQLF
ncbi:mitochondrial transcription termination factorfamily protein [Striga asiatica]|uniref:Mitochondrial transcription termination factorfamily protein n=1 Tax=Striga asiatica TaxID=4170 RepID=A0A5A7QV84_STRAF|nr:mitochondrial transcription termination factorfamily protein [Striga asiatica]